MEAVRVSAFADLLQMLLEKKIKPLISNEFPLEQTVEAIAMIQNRKATGKVIVTVDHAGDLF